MIRLVNQFDSSEHLPSTLVASGGANCSSCTSSCSCIVTAVVVSVVSARMVPGLMDTGAGAATPKVGMKRRLMSATIIPLIILLLFITVYTSEYVLVFTVSIYIGYLVVISRGTARPKKFILLHILLIVAWLGISLLEMAVWMQFIQ